MCLSVVAALRVGKGHEGTRPRGRGSSHGEVWMTIPARPRGRGRGRGAGGEGEGEWEWAMGQ